MAKWRTQADTSVESIDDGHGLRIVLPIVPPSANVLKRKYGNFISAGIRRFVRDRLYIALPTAGLDRLVPQTERRCVKYTVYRARLLDDDNRFAGTKPITDALVDLGLLKDDSPAWATVTVDQVAGVPEPERRTEILIEGADE